MFVSPFGRDDDAATRLDTRRGTVLGGGVVTEPREIQLLLNDPSAGVASRIRNRLNNRYGALGTVAEAASASLIGIEIPANFKDEKEHFVDLVRHTMLRSDRPFVERRSQELAKEITHPDALYESIALAWEAIGPPALPTVRDLYANPSVAAYYAARTGLRLGDDDALDVVARRFAIDRKSVLRERAVAELGNASREMHRASELLRDLLDDPDTRVRIAAYRALRRYGHPAVHSTVLDQDNLILDVVDSTGPFLIYVQRSRLGT